jgi:hypothetical protein
MQMEECAKVGLGVGGVVEWKEGKKEGRDEYEERIGLPAQQLEQAPMV